MGYSNVLSCHGMEFELYFRLHYVVFYNAILCYVLIYLPSNFTVELCYVIIYSSLLILSRLIMCCVSLYLCCSVIHNVFVTSSYFVLCIVIIYCHMSLYCYVFIYCHMSLCCAILMTFKFCYSVVLYYFCRTWRKILTNWSSSH